MTELLIVGGGIMGLWAGVMAERAGIKTVLVERDRFGAGASGGVLGALMPYMPDKWDDKKQLQFASLCRLEDEVESLEEQTGLSVGYRRSGRIIPLPKPHLRTIALRHEQDALLSWQTETRRFFWRVKDSSGIAGWPADDATGSGVILDTLAARLDPRAMIAALAAFLRQSRHVRLMEGRRIERLDPRTGTALFADGETLKFGACVLAAGTGSFGLLDTLHDNAMPTSGTAVKGQAALLRADVDPALPVIFFDGIYIVPHENGLVAVGSTSENSFTDPVSTDGKLDDLLVRARRIAPVLADAPVVERWAGLRPKPASRDPMVGVHPEHHNLHILTGGFKISFGIAHRLAESVIGGILGKTDPELPASFVAANHIAALRDDMQAQNARNPA